MSYLNLSRPLNRTLWVGSLLTLAPVSGGYIGIHDVKAVKREAEGLALELQMKQRRTQEPDGTVRRLNDKVRELERMTQAALEEAARREL